VTGGHNGGMRCVPAALSTALLLGLVACGGGDDDASPPTASASSVTARTTAAVATTAGPLPTALVPGTEGGDPLYPEPTTAPTEPLITTPNVSAAPTTVAATVASGTTGPPVSEPVAVQELVLSGEGVGSSLFGTDPEAVIQYVTSILGSNTADTGWVPPDTFGFCPGSEVRRVDWGVLSLLFGDGSDYTTGRRHFMAWEYGRLGQVGDEPVGLRTAGGVTLGSRVVDVLGEFPDATLIPGDPDVELPDQFYVDDTFTGLLSGTGEDDFVTVMFGGPRRCEG
jgi:hypothetical protein